jgi:hypothetical protein
MKQQKKAYQFHTDRYESQGGYSHLTVSIVRETSYDHKAIVSVSWQSDEGHGYWYAPKVKIEVGYSERWTESRNLTNSLDRWLKKNRYHCIGNLTPKILLEWLKMKRMAEVVYDPRLSDYVGIDQIQDAEIRRWMDDYRKTGSGGCTVSVMARTETEAKKKMFARFATLISETSPSDRYDKALARWLQYDRPVRLDTNADIRDRDLRKLEEKMVIEWAEVIDFTEINNAEFAE